MEALGVARSSAVKARSEATNQIKALIISGPPELREQLRHLPTAKIIASCARLRPGHQLREPAQATETPCVDSPDAPPRDVGDAADLIAHGIASSTMKSHPRRSPGATFSPALEERRRSDR
jgi:hypothetical protein